MVDKNDIRLFLAEYGEVMRSKRHKAKLPQIQVAHFIGVSQAIISHIECGLMLPPKEIENAIIEIYEEAENEKTHLQILQGKNTLHRGV
jgi:predicted transcriptional regulator